MRLAGTATEPAPSAGLTGSDPRADATGLLSLLLGLSIAILLEQTDPAEAIVVLDAHLDRLTT